MPEYDKPYHCPWVAMHKDGNIFDLSAVKSAAEKQFKEIGFDQNWKLTYVPENMHDPQWWAETPCKLPSEFFNQ